jgi:hypothetical protein
VREICQLLIVLEAQLNYQERALALCAAYESACNYQRGYGSKPSEDAWPGTHGV